MSASAWRRNAWLLALGGLLAAVPLGLGRERFVTLAAHVYATLPTVADVFRDDLERQVRTLWSLAVGLGAVLLACYAVFGRLGLDAAAFLLSRPGAAGAAASKRERARTLVAAVALGYAMLFVPLRLVRDLQRERALAGVPYAGRRVLVYGRHTAEPDYAALAQFQRRSGGRGDVLVLRSRARDSFQDVFRASFLHPQRVYFVRPSACTPGALAAARQRHPGARFVDWDCGDRLFAPEEIAP